MAPAGEGGRQVEMVGRMGGKKEVEEGWRVESLREKWVDRGKNEREKMKEKWGC